MINRKARLFKCSAVILLLFGADMLTGCSGHADNDNIWYATWSCFTNNSDNYSWEVDNFKQRCRATLKQTYFTLDQLTDLQKRANTLSSTLITGGDGQATNYFVKRFNNQHVVDNKDGHVYLVRTQLHTYGSVSDPRQKVVIKLTPIADSKSSEIDPNWKKNHED